ncbi:DUF3307 domain-containing protein [Henriciella aquimarina]|uniref:DUF3307 domain-containing protein n=1 Tax=Henriciella aquimarina TaxID=545261 RepID=UPI000A077E5B|nr:DUF3307 domain-containing protein [Henriciella aquimarina]
MAETFVALLCAHLLADFPLQPDRLIRHKHRPAVLLGHALIVLVAAIVLLGGVPLLPLAILLATHAAMDAVKVYLLPDRLWSFLLDQGVHLVVILALAVAWPGLVRQGWWDELPSVWYQVYLSGLALTSGIIASLWTGAVLIRKATAGLMETGDAHIEGLPNGGFVIGCLERALVMLLIFIGQPSGVGFLIAAKSILRFGDVTNPTERKMTEYIIIGTFMSFGWGLLIAVLTLAGVRAWWPHALPVP